MLWTRANQPAGSNGRSARARLSRCAPYCLINCVNSLVFTFGMISSSGSKREIHNHDRPLNLERAGLGRQSVQGLGTALISSAERRVGKGCVRTVSSRGSSFHSNTKRTDKENEDK